MTVQSQQTRASSWGSSPRTTDAWVERARDVATQLAADAVQRHRANQPPYAEVRLLKEAGLVTLLGPVAHGGGGQDWTTALRVVRAVSAGDGSIGQLLGDHYLWSWAPRLVATPAQIEAVESQATAERWFFGGAVNPRDRDVVVRDEGDELVFTGQKSFSTGGRVSDVTVLEGVRVPWAAAAGYVGKVFLPRTYNTLNVPLIQLIFANLYLGIAEGALVTAASYTRGRTRPWPYTPDLKTHGTEEFCVLETYGDLRAKLWAAEALAERAAVLIEQINAHADTVTPAERGEAAVVIAAAKQVAIDVGLEVGTKVLRGHGRPGHRELGRPGHLLAQHPDPQPARPDRPQAGRGRPLRAARGAARADLVHVSRPPSGRR
jgi:alkylation response protein AidB-like acyl-CoA dehydrogenase